MTKLESAELKTALVYDHPLLVRRGEHEFVRAIQSSGGRGELNLHCALHDGEVVRLGRSVEPSHQLAEEFRRLHDDLGSQRWDICIGFDSILRRLAFERSGSLAAVEAIYIKEKMVGLHTYGEQINGHHVNYSVTGVAIVHD